METSMCTCTVHKCVEYIDPTSHTKLGGRPQPMSTLKRHTNDELAYQRSLEAAMIHKEILKTQEDAMVRLVKDMQLTDAKFPEYPHHQSRDRWRIDKSKAQIAAISAIKDAIPGLYKDLDAFLSPPTSSSIILSRLIDLENAIDRGVQMQIELNLAAQRSHTPSVLALYKETQDILSAYLEKLKGVQTELHNDQQHRAAVLEEASTDPDSCISDHHFEPILSGVKPIVQLIIIMIVACSVILRVSRRGCSWLFGMTYLILQTAILKAFGDRERVPVYFRDILGQFPKDIRTASAQLRLEGKSTIYAVCPSCHQSYAPSLEGSIPIYSQRCNYRKYSGGSRCGELLVRPKLIYDHTIFVPIKPYIVFDFKDWLAGLMARPGYEDMMDDSWKDLNRPRDGKMTSIFHGTVLRDFKGPDGKTHFSNGGDEGRYAFAMGFDFFNPLTNKQAGKKTSVGLIALACLNLPIEHRYKPENMFLAAIIPGPHEPPIDRVNSYISPIVDFFVQFWIPGVHFTRTCKYPFGRLVLCALLLIICDLLAANKVACSSSHNSNLFCGVCWFDRRTGERLADFDVESWKRRTNEDWRYHAERFRTAQNATEAKKLFLASGLRWSELLRLPYFDPTRFIVVDPMHNMLLGLMRTHFTEILGFQLKEQAPFEIYINIPQDDSNPLPTETKLANQIKSIIDTLQRHIEPHDLAKIEGYLGRRPMLALVYVAKGISCSGWNENGRKKPTRASIAARLIAWRRDQCQPKHIPPQAGSVFTPQELQELWNDIQEIITPSWLTSVPTEIGVSGGTPKADEWRALSVYLPIALAKLWGNPDPDDARSMRRAELLDLTLTFISAVDVVMSRETSKDNAEEFLRWMKMYRTDLKRLFPDYTYTRPNFHVSLHIAEFMCMFGPVHGWWTYPFERMIGMLQRISTNYKPGEYEETIGSSWYRSCNLRALFSENNSRCPQALQQCAALFSRLVSREVRNTLTVEMTSSAIGDATSAEYLASRSEKPIPAHVQDALRDYCDLLQDYAITEVPSKAQFLSHLTVEGVRFTTRATHLGNSNILVRGLSNEEIPASIEHILRLPNSSDAWVLVRCHKDIDVHDPFLTYPLIRAKMWSSLYHDRLDVVHFSSLTTHFAKHTFCWEDKQVVIASSLSRILLVSEIGSRGFQDQ